MYIVTEAQAAEIRAALANGGEFSAAVELRRIFPALLDNAEALAQVRVIAGWAPLPQSPPRSVTRLRLARERALP